MALTRREVLFSAAGLAQARRPNIVFILSDDHRWDALSCTGHPWIRTPHLDRLAARGAHFQNAFVTTSLCSPSRASILSGQYVHAHGVADNFSRLPEALPTFPKLLRQAGYRTGFIGKWHMGDAALAGGEDFSDQPQGGFDHWIGCKGQGEYVNPELNFNGRRRKVSGYFTDILTDEATRFIDSSRDQPFLLYLSHKAVHAEFQAAGRHSSLYAGQRQEIPASATIRDGKPDWLLRKRDRSRHGLANLYAGSLSLDELARRYARTLAGLDESVGGVVDALGRRGLSENTLVIYMGDNGYLLGEQGLVDKRVMYDPSIRVPLIAAWPGRISTGKPSGFALNIDIAPTLLEAAGLRAPGTMHGRSLWPQLRGEAPEWRDGFVYEYFWDWEAMHTPGILGYRSRDFSYMEYQGVWDRNELYDMRADPDQLRNLIPDSVVETQAGGWLQRIADPARRDQVRDLRHRMVSVLEATGGAHLTRGPQ